jgi:hypothetical protein
MSVTAQEHDNSGADRSELRKFGITMACGFAAFGTLVLWRGKSFFPYLYIASAVFLILGLVVPISLKSVHKVWMTLAAAMGWFMTRVILTILFFAVFTPIGAIARLLGKQFLDFRMDASRDTYWIRREPKEFRKSDYERQF